MPKFIEAGIKTRSTVLQTFFGRSDPRSDSVTSTKTATIKWLWNKWL